VAGAIVFSYTRALPPLYPKVATVAPPATVSNPIVWPNSQEAAFGANGF